MPSEVTEFLQTHGMGMYACIMDDQGFEDLIDLVTLTQDEDAFKELVPALGHRTKVKRLLSAALHPCPSQSNVDGSVPIQPPVAVPTVVTSPPVVQPPPVPSPLRTTALVAWLAEHHLEGHCRTLQLAGYDEVADLVELTKNAELFEHLVPMVGHRERIRRILLPPGHLATPASRTSIAEQWLGGVKLPLQAPDPELLSSGAEEHGETRAVSVPLSGNDAVTKLLHAVGSQFVMRKTPSTVSPPQAGALLEDDHDVPSASPQSSLEETRIPTMAEHRANVQGRATHVTVKDYPGGPYDASLFVDNPGLHDAAQSSPGTVPLCLRNACNPSRCNQLHFREFQIRHEHVTRTCSAAYVTQVTCGLLAAMRKSDRVLACLEDGCNASSCGNAHISFPIKRLEGGASNGGTPDSAALVPLRDCSVTDALSRFMERPQPLHDRKYFSKVKRCPAFALSQICVKGSKCWNYHILPPNFCRYFFRNFPLDRLGRHLHSLNHLPGDSFDAAKRMDRTSRSFDVGEALDIMCRTSCRPCALIFFEAFRASSRRQGNDILWALMHRFFAHQGREDPVMQELIVFVNNLLQLRHTEAITATSSMESIVPKVTEAILLNLKKHAALFERAVGTLSTADHSRQSAYVFWDFDNILFAERGDLALFFHCLMTFLCREGYASGKGAIHVKAFGTQNSFESDMVDTLRDMQVEMVLCSSKKQEETDRQMERSMRSLEGRKDATVVILSSDKDFGSIAKDLTRTGVHVLVVHCAEESSSHESMLQITSSRSAHIFELYASALKSFKLVRPHNNNAAATSQDRLVLSELLTSTGPPPSATSAVRRDTFQDPAVVASQPVAERSTPSEPPVPPRSILEFFKHPDEPRTVAASRDASGHRPHSSTGIPLPRSATVMEPAAAPKPHHTPTTTATDGVNVGSVSGGINLASFFANKINCPSGPQPGQSTHPPLKVACITSLVKNPQPPQEHRLWYTLFVDSFLVRLQDCQRKGVLRGPFLLVASEDAARREIRLYVEMAVLVPKLLPPWFRSEIAVRHIFKKVMDESPDDWMSDEHFVATYDVEQFVEVFATLRYIATVVEGPLGDGGEEEDVCVPMVPIRLQCR